MKKKLNICRWWINTSFLLFILLILLLPKDTHNLLISVYALSVSFLNVYIKAMIEKLPPEDGDSKPLEEGSKQE